MDNYVKQFRYFGDGDDRNEPYNLTSRDLTNKDSTFLKYLPATSVKIEGTPGLAFYINDPDRQSPIVLGPVGIYIFDKELITLLRFEAGQKGPADKQNIGPDNSKYTTTYNTKAGFYSWGIDNVFSEDKTQTGPGGGTKINTTEPYLYIQLNHYGG